MTEQKALQTSEPRDIANLEDSAMTIEGVIRQVNLIQEVMSRVMKDGEHYGVIPGTDKPTLYKPGAEKICTTFRLAPSYEIKRTDMANGHREYEIISTLTHIPSGQIFGQGVGSCSTMESKYRFRKAEQTCPDCGKNAIIKGKKQYGGGWLCFKKKDGCGAKFKDGDPVIENQEMGRIEYDNPADYYNTVLKIGKKRAHVDVVLTATAASDIFTQDLEDLTDNGVKPQSNGKKPDKPTDSAPPEENGNPKIAEAGHLQSMWAHIDSKGWTEEEAKAWIYEKFDVSTCTTLTTTEINKAMKYFNDNPKTKTDPPDQEKLVEIDEAGNISEVSPNDNPEAWLPNDALLKIFDQAGIEKKKEAGDKIRQYMATQGRTGDEVEAQLERLGIYTSPEAWKVFSEKALF